MPDSTKPLHSFWGNLKQDWDLAKNRTDRDIESIIREIDGTWYNNPYRR